MLAVPTVETLAYGPGPSQRASLHRPDGPGPHPVVVLIHGGFWWARFDRTLMTALALDLVSRGWAAWNLEYRRVGEDGGGWPGTLADAARAVDHLDRITSEQALDVGRVVAVGHSAGGHLALWLAGRATLPAGAPGAKPTVRLRTAVAQAGVTDLRAGFALDLGPGACAGLLGGSPDELPDRYEIASPMERLPTGVPQLLVHGDADRLVPIDLTRRYAAAAAEVGDAVEVVELAGVGHFEHLDPGHPAWLAVVDRLALLRP